MNPFSAVAVVSPVRLTELAYGPSLHAVSTTAATRPTTTALFVNLITVGSFSIPDSPVSITYLLTYLVSAPVSSSSVHSPLSSSISPSLLHFRLPVSQILSNVDSLLLSSFPPYCIHGLIPGPFFLSNSVFVLFSFSLLFCFWQRLLD